MRAEQLSEFEMEALKLAGMEALKAAKKVHDDLGEDGLTPVPSPNQFGEQALKGDVEAEKALLDTLAFYKIPIRVISEEHGTTNIADNPIYLAVADGIDGSANYREGRGLLRYATMLGIYSNLDPVYGDYIFSGMMEHPSSKLWHAESGRGSFVLDLSTRQLRKPLPSKAEVVTSTTRIYTALSYKDTPLDRSLEDSLRPYNTTSPKCSATSFADLASGAADIQVETTRKGNLEQMVAYGFVKEAGAVMITLSGTDLGRERYFHFGQETTEAIITAANPKLAADFLRKIKANAKPF